MMDMLVHPVPLLDGTRVVSAIQNCLYWLPPPFCLRSDSFIRGAGGMDTEHFIHRIRELCARAIMAKDSEIEPVITELQAALREHALMVRNMAAKSLLAPET